MDKRLTHLTACFTLSVIPVLSFSGSVSAGEIEFTDLVAAYLPSASMTSLGDFTTLKAQAGPITWQSKDKGSVVVVVKGVPTFYVYEPTKAKALWNIELQGSRTIINKVTISNGINAGWLWEPLDVLKQRKFKVSQIDCFKEPAVGGYEKYEISLGAKRAFLTTERSCGSAGCSIDFVLTSNRPSKGGCLEN
jgi:hypothetical protein